MELSLLFLAAFPLAVLSLLEDQVGSYDWYDGQSFLRCALIGISSRRRVFVGSVSYLSVEQSARSSRGVVAASEAGVLAVLDPDDGSVGESCMMGRGQSSPHSFPPQYGGSCMSMGQMEALMQC